MEMLRKLQQLPDAKKKLIVWGITILAGVVLLIWWIPQTLERLQRLPQESVLGDQFQELPNIEVPEIE